MEGYYSDNEDEDQDDIEESSKSKKKSVIKSGFFGIELKSEKPKKDENQKREDLLSLLTKKTVEIVDSDEKDDDIEELSVVEVHDVEQQIAFEHQVENQLTIENETDAKTIEILEAVDNFHDKIVNEDIDSSAALSETLAEITEPEEESINLRANYNSSPSEITEEPVSLRVTTESPKSSSTEVAINQPSASVIKPIFDRVSSLDVPFKRSETNKPEEHISVNTIADRLINIRQENAKSEKPTDVIKQRIERQVARIETEIKTKELTIIQAVKENSKIKPEITDEEFVRIKAHEANRLHSSAAPERIGKVLVKAEANKLKPIVEVGKLRSIDNQVETISRSDLLELSNKTLVDGTTLRKVYDSNLITEKGLRRILIEHLRGGDIKRALKRELVEHEKDFERDPNIRDKSRDTSYVGKAVNKLIMKIDSEIIEKPDQLDKILNTQINISAKNLTKKRVKVSWFDIGLLILIGVLLTLVLTLVMKRH